MCATTGPSCLIRSSGSRDDGPASEIAAERLRVLVVDRRGDAARARRVLLVVERVAALTDHLERRPHRLGRDDRVSVMRGRPFTLRMRVDLLVGQRGEDRLADAGRVQRNAAAELHQDAHHLAALDLRDEHRLGAVENREVRGLARLLHQPAHVRRGSAPTKSRLARKLGADGERLQADVPAPEIAGLVDVAHLSRASRAAGAWSTAADRRVARCRSA